MLKPATTTITTSAAMPAPRLAPPLSWGATPYRGCTVCQHGRTSAGQPSRAQCRPAGHHLVEAAEATHCAHPRSTQHHPGQATAAGVPVHLARAHSGACGPEAYLQAFPGLTLS